MPELDPKLSALLLAGIKVGISALPDGVDPKFKTAAETCLFRGLEWTLRQIEPSNVIVEVENDASATAEIKWSDSDS